MMGVYNSMAIQFSLFLNNEYSDHQLQFYLKRIKRTFTVAVDGGIRFFLNNNIYPDVLIGDFDSSPRLSPEYLTHMEVLTYPTEKDKTDSQLALELALARGAEIIEIFGAVSEAEIDHTLGNIFLLELVNKFNRDNDKNVSARLIGPDMELAMIENGEADFHARKDDYLSIIPMSANPKVEFIGLRYPPPARPLRIGESLSLRNQFTGRQAHIKIAGKAIVVAIRKK